MNRLLSLLSLTRRAGKLGLGFDPVKEAVQRREAALVLLAADLSPKTKKEVQWFCRTAGCPVRELPATMDGTPWANAPGCLPSQTRDWRKTRSGS